ncbi:hypothetical protein [Nocardia puris]|uniref:hypothetical protein n=1 Tax=Nocardia puris TaxID=208602 RepID=UPI000AA4F8F7|nr:hypothetical protein [Nocardia puris]
MGTDEAVERGAPSNFGVMESLDQLGGCADPDRVNRHEFGAVSLVDGSPGEAA